MFYVSGDISYSLDHIYVTMMISTFKGLLP